MIAFVLRRAVPVALAVVLLACGGPASPGQVGGPARGIAVVGSDYTSSSIAVLDADTGLLAVEGLLHSGSEAPGLSVALSGDVVLPSSTPLPGILVLVDRYPAGVLTVLDPSSDHVWFQAPVAAGFAANPQDVLFWDVEKAYVSRYEPNPDPDAITAERGDDLVVLALDFDGFGAGARRAGRVSFAPLLAELGSADLDARPGRLARAGDRLWVALGHLSRHFDRAGDAIVARVDPRTDTVDDAAVIPGVANCTAVVASDPFHVYAACSGLVQDGRAAQLERSALVVVDAGAAHHPTARVVASAADGRGGPFGFDLQVAGGRWLLAVRWGDLTTGEPDRLVALDLKGPDGVLTEVHVAGTAYGLGGVLADDAHGRVYVGDANPTDPRVYVYRVTDAGFEPETSVVSHPSSGLPPRTIGLYGF
jgi:hypothetical protein